MRIWISGLLMLLIILASLSIAPHLTKVTEIIKDASVSNLSLTTIFCGMAILALLAFENVWRRLFSSYQPSSHQHFSYQPPDGKPRSITALSLSLTSRSTLLLQAVIGLLMLITVALHSIQTVQTEHSKEVSAPIRVLAKVTPIGISDSNFYASDSSDESDSNIQTSYRQLAVIESAEPLTPAHFTTKATKADFTTDNNSTQLAQLTGKTVLLSAGFQQFSKKTALPSGFSTDFVGLNQLAPNQSTHMMLAIDPLPATDTGFIHRWLRSRHVNGQARVLAYQQNFTAINDPHWQTSLNHWRWQVRQHFLQDWDNHSNHAQQARAVTLSLFTGDRALINQRTKTLYQLSGISHLLAISGTHVLFLAIVLSVLVINIVNHYCVGLYSIISRHNLRWLVMITGALLYALFTGFEVPSARTVYMLAAVGIARWLLLDISARQVLLIVAALMAVYDPYVLWQAGFWLSFVAVMLLISYDLSMNQLNATWSYADDSKIETVNLLDKFLPFLRLQLWMFVALLPLSLLLFGKVSLWGILVNVLAIGFYGWVIVPLNLLAGLLYWILPRFLHALPDRLWELVSGLLQGLHQGLSWLVGNEASSSAWMYTNVNAGMGLIIGLIVLPMLLPPRTFSRIWSLPPLILLMSLLYNQTTTQSSYSLSSSSPSSLSMSPSLSQPTDQQNHLSVSTSPYSHPKLTLLENRLSGANRFVMTQVLSYNHENWLIVANHQANARNHRKHLIDADKVTSQWQESLGKLGISSLTGIIIQTPSPELLQATQSLKVTVPIGYIWLAGKRHIEKTSSLKTINQFDDIIHSVLPCAIDTTHGNRRWQSDDGNLKIKAITGWQDIDDSGLWSCALRIESQSPIIIDPQYPLYWSGKQTNYAPMLATMLTTTDKNTGTTLPTTNYILLNTGSKNDKLWQLWTLLCPPNTSNFALPSHFQSAGSFLLTHSNNDFPDEFIEQNRYITNWALLNNANSYNQQKLPKLLLNWDNIIKRE